MTPAAAAMSGQRRSAVKTGTPSRVLDDHLAALSQAVLLAEFGRKADPAIRHDPGFHGVIPKCGIWKTYPI